MKFGYRLAGALVALALSLPLQAAQSPLSNPGYRSDEVLVRYRDAASAPVAKAMREGYGMEVRSSLAQGRIELLQLPAVITVEQALEVLQDDPAVDLAEPNFLRRKLAFIPNDPLFFEQWGLRNTGQANFVNSTPPLASTVGADMDLPRAWDRNGDGRATRVGDSSVTVAVIDDAFDTDHPDLAANFIAGYDFARDDSDPAPDSSAQGHGTMVTGALGAIGNNGIGVAGVAWNVKIMPLKVGNRGDLSSAAILAAYEHIRTHAAAHNIRIVNASYGGPSHSQLEFDAIRKLRDLGILFVAAAGNEDSNTDRAVRAYPANYDLDNIVSVAATNRQDNISSFSQYGALTVDIAAPGLQIVTTRYDNAYNYNAGTRASSGVSGTSFSSPYVAGIAALIAMEYPTASYHEIKARLIEGAQASGDEGLTHQRSRSGRANAYNSLTLTPRPSLALSAVRVDDADGNGRLDPGETADLVVTVENLWLAATNVQATLSAPAGTVTVTQANASIASLAPQASTQLRFTVQVPANPPSYLDIPFSLRLEAPGTYEATRSFSLEVAKLRNAQRVSGTLSTGLYDEFHTYHFDLASLPAGHRRLRFLTTAGRDIDLLIKRGTPPEYLITLAVNPDGEQIFSTDGLIGGDAGGNEIVCLMNPALGTYFATVVNYDQLTNTAYTLEAITDAESECPAGSSGDGSGRGSTGGSGGGSLPLSSLCLLLGLAWMRRRISKTGASLS